MNLSYLLLLPVLGAHTQYQASIRAEGRGRTQANSSTVEGIAEPGVKLQIVGERLQFSTGYSLWLISGVTQPTPQLLHRGQANLLWTVDSRLMFGLSGRASYGAQDFSLVTRTPGAAVGQTSGTGSSSTPDPSSSGGTAPTGGTTGTTPAVPGSTVPNQQRLPYEDLGGLFSTRYRVTHTSTFGLLGGYGISGSLDPAYRAQIPTQEGPSASLNWTEAFNHAQQGLVAVQAQHLRFSTQVETTAGDLYVGYRSRLSPLFTWGADLGAAASSTRSPTVPRASSLLPLAEVNCKFTGNYRGKWETSASLGARPIIDRITGAQYDRSMVSLSARWMPSERWDLKASGSGTYAFGLWAVQGEQVYQGELSSTVSLDKLNSVQFGARTAYFSSPRLPVPVLQSMAFASVAFAQGGVL